MRHKEIIIIHYSLRRGKFKVLNSNTISSFHDRTFTNTKYILESKGGITLAENQVISTNLHITIF